MANSDTQVHLLMNGVALHTEKHLNLIEVADLLFKNKGNAIIVREKGIPKGIITTKDILRALMTMEKSPSEILAFEIMTAPMVTIPHTASMEEAQNMMLSTGKRKVPVIKDLDVIGLLTDRDILLNVSKKPRLF